MNLLRTLSLAFLTALIASSGVRSSTSPEDEDSGNYSPKTLDALIQKLGVTDLRLMRYAKEDLEPLVSSQKLTLEDLYSRLVQVLPIKLNTLFISYFVKIAPENQDEFIKHIVSHRLNKERDFPLHHLARNLEKIPQPYWEFVVETTQELSSDRPYAVSSLLGVFYKIIAPLPKESWIQGVLPFKALAQHMALEDYGDSLYSTTMEHLGEICPQHQMEAVERVAPFQDNLSKSIILEALKDFPHDLWQDGFTLLEDFLDDQPMITRREDEWDYPLRPIFTDSRGRVSERPKKIYNYPRRLEYSSLEIRATFLGIKNALLNGVGPDIFKQRIKAFIPWHIGGSSRADAIFEFGRVDQERQKKLIEIAPKVIVPDMGGAAYSLLVTRLKNCAPHIWDQWSQFQWEPWEPQQRLELLYDNPYVLDLPTKTEKTLEKEDVEKRLRSINKSLTCFGKHPRLNPEKVFSLYI